MGCPMATEICPYEKDREGNTDGEEYFVFSAGALACLIDKQGSSKRDCQLKEGVSFLPPAHLPHAHLRHLSLSLSLFLPIIPTHHPHPLTDSSGLAARLRNSILTASDMIQTAHGPAQHFLRQRARQ